VRTLDFSLQFLRIFNLIHGPSPIFIGRLSSRRTRACSLPTCRAWPEVKKRTFSPADPIQLPLLPLGFLLPKVTSFRPRDRERMVVKIPGVEANLGRNRHRRICRRCGGRPVAAFFGVGTSGGTGYS
jgi:hypothetical protein